MIHYTNIKRYDGLPFQDYLKLPGLSHSFLKNEHNGISTFVEETEKMHIGKLVDAIITTPKNVDITDKYYPIAKDIAAFILKQYWRIVRRGEFQVAYTADVEFNGFHASVKGLIDILFNILAIIDLKVTWRKDIRELIAHMEYHNQIWHYCKLSKVPKGFLLIYSVPLRKVELIPVDCTSNSNTFWEGKIALFGKVKEETI